jgi:hypothetical protein
MHVMLGFAVVFTFATSVVMDEIYDKNDEYLDWKKLSIDEKVAKCLYHVTDIIIIVAYIYLYLAIKKEYEKISSGRKVKEYLKKKMLGNLRSLRIFFISIWVIYTLRLV